MARQSPRARAILHLSATGSGWVVAAGRSIEGEAVAGMRDLQQMLASLEPRVREGEYVYVTDPGDSTGPEPEALVREDEGITLVVRREVAEQAGLAFDFVACWITLTVHSSLDAVGLTAAFSTALAEAGITCNVLAGLHHDHVLVASHQREEALTVLQSLSSRHA
jgi:hypothetical protein